MPSHPDARYDSFVVRIWHDQASDRLLKAELEHVQTGAVTVGRGVRPAWVLRALLKRLWSGPAVQDAIETAGPPARGASDPG